METKIEMRDSTISDLEFRVKLLEEKSNVSNNLLKENVTKNDTFQKKLSENEEKIQHIYNLLFESIETKYKDLNDKLNKLLKKYSDLKFKDIDAIPEEPELATENTKLEKLPHLTKIKNLINIKTLTGHQGPITCIIQMKWPKNKTTFLTASGDKSIKIWNSEDGLCKKTLTGHTHWVYNIVQIKWEKDYDTIISGSRDMTLKIWNIEAGICLKSINAHNNLISGLVQVLGSETPLIASCSWDKTLKIWDLNDGI
jgi:WD40 repeat protein